MCRKFIISQRDSMVYSDWWFDHHFGKFVHCFFVILWMAHGFASCLRLNDKLKTSRLWIQCSYEVFWEKAIMCLYLGLHVLSFENHWILGFLRTDFLWKTINITYQMFKVDGNQTEWCTYHKVIHVFVACRFIW